MIHWKNYEPIESVVGFDHRGTGPHLEAVQVTANCSSNPDYPECRIAVHIGKLASGALTLEQSAALRARLEHAERDIRAALVSTPLVATGDEGRCESCAEVIRAGEPIVVEDDDTEDRVVLHAGPCPGEAVH